MKITNSILLLSLIALLTGCASDKIWVGKNSENDYYDCQAKASMTYPPSMTTTKLGSGYSSPINTTCSSFNGIVNCTSTGGTYTPPAEITIDINKDKRLAHFGHCMIQRGNQLVSKDDYTPTSAAQKQQYNKDDNCKDKYSIHYDPKICENN